MPRSAGSAAVSSNDSSARSARSSSLRPGPPFPERSAPSVAESAAGRRNVGGLTRLLNRNYHGTDEKLIGQLKHVQTHSSVHEQGETEHLQQGDREKKLFPSEGKTDDPDAECATGIGQAARGRGHMAGDTETKVVEEGDADRNRDSGVEDWRVVDHLVPTAR